MSLYKLDQSSWRSENKYNDTSLSFTPSMHYIALCNGQSQDLKITRSKMHTNAEVGSAVKQDSNINTTIAKWPYIGLWLLRAEIL